VKEKHEHMEIRSEEEREDPLNGIGTSRRLMNRDRNSEKQRRIYCKKRIKNCTPAETNFSSKDGERYTELN
jgi:hypothetical protein